MANPNIYTAFKRVPIPDADAILSGIVNEQATIQAQKDKAQQAQDQATVRQVLQSTGGDRDATIKKLREVGAFGAADALETAMNTQAEKRADIMKKGLDSQAARNKMASGYFAALAQNPTDDAVNVFEQQFNTLPLDPDDPPDAHQRIVQQIRQADPTTRAALLEQMTQGMLDQVEQNKQAGAHLEALYGKDPVRGAAGLAATATDAADYAQEYQVILSSVKDREARSVIKAKLPDPSTVTPENWAQVKAHLDDLSTTETEKTNRMNAETQRLNAEKQAGFTLGQGQQRFGPDGKLIAGVAPRPVAQSGGGAGAAGGTGSKNAEGKPLPDDYQTLLARSMFAVPATRRGLIIQTANRLWAEGKLDDLKDVIRQSAVEGENVDTKNLIRGRRATLASLSDTRQILEELQAKGVPTGFMTGTMEDLARKLGNTTNPEYVALANRLAGTLINYRRAATGVAFGEREAAQYEKMFPNYKNELPVNLGLIKGLEREMTTYDRAYWEDKMGKAGAELLGVVPPAAGSKTAASNVAADDVVPGPIAALLAKQKDGRYTLSDGYVYEVRGGVAKRLPKEKK